MNQSTRSRKPQLAVDQDIHQLVKQIADQRKTKIESVTDEVIVAGLKVKKLLPENFRPQDN